MKAVHSVLFFVALMGIGNCLVVRKYVFVPSTLNWINAQTYCRKNYVDLLTINSAEELNNFNIDAANYLMETSWIGLSRTLQETAYTGWSDGSKLEFPNWKPGEPKMMNRYLCVYVFKSAFGVDACSGSLPFFCYKWAPQIIMVQEMMNWEEALNHCRTHYTDLMSLNTDNDLLAAKNATMTIQTPSVWTGLRYIDGQWFWVNKEPLMNLSLVSSCPIRPFQCGALKTGSYIMEGRNCNEKMTFICYY